LFETIAGTALDQKQQCALGPWAHFVWQIPMSALPTLLPLSEAARKYGISQSRLKDMIEHGTIKAAMIMGELVVDEQTLPRRKEDLPEYNSTLVGKEISISDAANEYKIPTGTITRWMQKGIVKRLGSDGYRTLIDKADIDYCSKIYHRNRGKKQGRRLFDQNGLPYKRTNPVAG